MDLSQIIFFFTQNYILLYLILFISSYFEIIFIIFFYIPKEIFFLIGSILSGMGYLNIWVLIIILYIGGILGDSTSFFIGRKYKKKIFNKLKNKKFFKKIINENNYKKGNDFFKKFGKKSIFFTKFLRHTSWTIPFVIGNHNLKYSIFLKYEIPAIILGIGQFILIGYFIGLNYKILIEFLSKYVFIMIFIIISILFIYYYLKQKYINIIKEKIHFETKKIFSNLIKYLLTIIIFILVLFSLFLYILFFGNSQILNSNNSSFNKLNLSINLNKLRYNSCHNLNVYYKDNPTNYIQRINIIIYLKKNISSLMTKKWTKNEIFQRNNITLQKYFRLILNKTLPQSNLYFLNISQNLAFQEKTNSLFSREHIRFWKFKSNLKNYKYLYFGSISNDTSLEFQFYNKFITPVHRINSNLDLSRNLFKNYLLNTGNFKCNYVLTNCKIKKNNESENEQTFYTDGKILRCYQK